MPLYEYTCDKCGNEFEELVSMNAKENPGCPSCGSSDTRKKVSLTGGFSGLSGGGSSGGCVPRSGFS